MAEEGYIFSDSKGANVKAPYDRLIGMVKTDIDKIAAESTAIEAKIRNMDKITDSKQRRETARTLREQAQKLEERSKHQKVEVDPLRTNFQKMGLLDKKAELVDEFGQPVELPYLYKKGDEFKEEEQKKRQAFLESMKQGKIFYKDESGLRHTINLNSEGMNVERKVVAPAKVEKPSLWSRIKSLFVKVPEVELYKKNMEYVRKIYDDNTINGSFNRDEYEKSKNITGPVITVPVKEQAPKAAEQEKKAPEAVKPEPEKKAPKVAEPEPEKTPEVAEPEPEKAPEVAESEPEKAPENVQIDDDMDDITEDEMNQISEDELNSLLDEPEKAEPLTDEEAERKLAEMDAQMAADEGPEEPEEFGPEVERDMEKLNEEIEREKAAEAASVKEEPAKEEPAVEEISDDAPAVDPQEKEEVMDLLANRGVELGAQTGPYAPKHLSDEERIDLAAENALDRYVLERLRSDDITPDEARTALDPEAKQQLLKEIKEDPCFIQALEQAKSQSLNGQYRSSSVAIAFCNNKEMQEKDLSTLVSNSQKHNEKLGKFYDKVQESIEVTNKAAAGELDLSDENVRQSVREASATMYLYVMTKSPMAPKLKEKLAGNPEGSIRDLAKSPQMEVLLGANCEHVGSFVKSNAFKMQTDFAKACRIVNDNATKAREAEANTVRTNPENEQVRKDDGLKLI